MRDKADQLSGFQDCTQADSIYAQFTKALKASAPDLLDKALIDMREREGRRKRDGATDQIIWNKVKADHEVKAFSFGFSFEGNNEGIEEDDIQ